MVRFVFSRKENPVRHVVHQYSVSDAEPNAPSARNVRSFIVQGCKRSWGFIVQGYNGGLSDTVVITELESCVLGGPPRSSIRIFI